MADDGARNRDVLCPKNNSRDEMHWISTFSRVRENRRRFTWRERPTRADRGGPGRRGSVRGERRGGEPLQRSNENFVRTIAVSYVFGRIEGGVGDAGAGAGK